MDISGNNNNRTGTLIVVQRKNYLTPINLPSIKDKSYPRIGSLPRNYRAAFLALIEHYQQTDQLHKAEPVLKKMRAVLYQGILPMEPGMAKWLDYLDAEISKAR